jgi:uncharacterized protein YutE (UPF0331/DUF86 family)
MVSTAKIISKFSQLDEYLSILQRIIRTPREEFLKDKIIIGSAKYYLQVSIECCLDISNHIIAAERYRAPKDYADTFKILEEEGVIDAQLSLKLRQMAKFRNRLVHLYGGIDDAYVYAFITKDLQDVTKFRAAIHKKYLT